MRSIKTTFFMWKNRKRVHGVLCDGKINLKIKRKYVYDIHATGEKAPEYEYCNTWFHIFCEKYSNVEFEQLNKPRSHWFCKSCDGKAIDVLQIVRNLKEFRETIVERMEAVEKKVDLVEKVEGRQSCGNSAETD